MSKHLFARCASERESARPRVRPLTICVAEPRKGIAIRSDTKLAADENPIGDRHDMNKDTDMKKIKSKLVTIVTDNVRRVGIATGPLMEAASRVRRRTCCGNTQP